MRVLVVSDVPLVPELGAAQSAFGLAEGLRNLGHEVTLWSPGTPPSATASSRVSRWRSRRLEAFLVSSARFDIIDASPLLITARVAAAGPTVARSIQPEWQYRWLEVAAGFRGRPLSPSTYLGLLHSLTTWSGLRQGWRRSSRILCLGSLEARWMRARYSKWRHRIGSYRAAPRDADREVLREVRRSRVMDHRTGAPRLLWIGRWTTHKGVSGLREWMARPESRDFASTLTIAGCGRGVSLELPTAWTAAGRVEIVGEFQRAELAGLLKRHDAGLFTSLVEGWGLGLQEMLESGLPVFATEAGAVPDLAPTLSPLLRRFPPAEPAPLGASAEVDWDAYEHQFNWPQIAREYIDFVCESESRGLPG